MTALDYGKQACDAMIHRYEAKKLPPEGIFFYHQGVFLNGVQEIYKLCGDKKYYEYVKEYVDSMLGSNGEVPGFDHEYTNTETQWFQKTALSRLDNRQPVILLYLLYEESREEKYKKAIETITKSMYYYPINSVGGYWHMMDQPYQMWMDGAYIIGPLSVMYSKRFGDNTLRERAIKQVFIMDEHLKDPKTGLYFHGWDPTKKAPWADQETGLSQNIWGRFTC